MKTSAGSKDAPSGQARISAWVDNPRVNNTSLRAYGGDLQGNVWRFDINTKDSTPVLLATLQDAAKTAQPITTKPELGKVGDYQVVFVGTGRYLGTTDMGDTSKQSFYAIKDDLTGTGVGVPRTGSFVQQDLTEGTCSTTQQEAGICLVGQPIRTGSKKTMDFGSQSGWFIDLPTAGERDNTDPTLALGTIGFTSNVPTSTLCQPGGYSYRYFLDYRSGAPVATASNVVSVRLGDGLGTRPVYVRLPNNKVIQLTRLSNRKTVTINVPIAGVAGSIRRVTLRELTTDQ